MKHSLKGLPVGLSVVMKFDPTKEDVEDAGARPVDHEIAPWLVDYRLATGANRLVETDHAALAAGSSDDLSGLTALEAVIIQNPKSNAYAVTVVYRTAGGAATNQTMVLDPGQFCVLADVAKATALTYTSATANQVIKRWYVGY